ncbi:hypothetical protein L195_g059709, partial [Trifolium pratense]
MSLGWLKRGRTTKLKPSKKGLKKLWSHGSPPSASFLCSSARKTETKKEMCLNRKLLGPVCAPRAQRGAPVQP